MVGGPPRSLWSVLRRKDQEQSFQGTTRLLVVRRELMVDFGGGGSKPREHVCGGPRHGSRLGD
jgi:hypothetical protein